jgi:hypothetical protein
MVSGLRLLFESRTLKLLKDDTINDYWMDAAKSMMQAVVTPFLSVTNDLFLTTPMAKRDAILAEPGESSSSSSSSFPYYWNLSYPKWPREPPALLPDCKVVFRPDSVPQRLCHIVPWGANFGDELGPPIIQRILELYFRCSATDLPTLNLIKLKDQYMNRSSNVDTSGRVASDGSCLLAVGSLWRFAQTGDHLWGTGVAFDSTVKHRCTKQNSPHLIRNLTIYSSRGPNSAAQIQEYCPFANLPTASSSGSAATRIPTAGDAGFLIPYLFPESIPSNSTWPKSTTTTTTTTTVNSSNQRMCIIPHHDERNNKQFRTAEREYKAIRLTVQQTWPSMVASLLNKCDVVLSSSLHGIIFAETLGIPSKRFRLTQQPGDFKFDDFYASYRGEGDGAPTNDSGRIASMEHLYARNLTIAMNNWLQPLSVQQRDAYARRVLETFPIHLFETVQVQRT